MERNFEKRQIPTLRGIASCCILDRLVKVLFTCCITDWIVEPLNFLSQVTTEPPPSEGEGSEGLSLQDRRKQLLEQQKQKKLKQQIAMGLVSSTATANASESVVQVCLQGAG